MRVRQATITDLPEVSRVHAVCFPDSYSTQLSKYSLICGNLLNRFYQEYIEDNPELFLVAEDDNYNIVGFCMGYYMDKDNQMSNFMLHNRFPILMKTIVLIALMNRPTWRKVLARFKHKPDISDWTIVNYKYEDIGNDKRGDLLSVCVLPEYRGRGFSQQLMESYLTVMKEHGRELCLLSVKTANERARHYYERNGFELYRTRGAEGLTYIKKL